jgi:protein TonB
MEPNDTRHNFEFYTRYQRRRIGERDFFFPVMMVSILVFGGIGLYLRVNNPPPETVVEQMSRMQQTRFIIEEPKPVPNIEKPKPKPKPKVKKEEAVIPEEPIDLTKKPLLDQKKDEIDELPPPEEVKKPPRRVYGLKKVYSTGIGASGSAADAIIGKRGNTLNTDIDTISATESDLKSPPVSITRVTSPPRPKTQVKPEYTKEMLENRVEGVVRVKVLVDIDGRVKQAIVLDDLGYGSKEKVAEACFKMVFEPGRIGEEPVSTWIMMRFRFKMLQG